MSDPEAFYDQLADVYSDCTNVQAKNARALDFAKRLCDRLGPRRVLDAACGTGLYALAFAKLGMDATAADLSARQIRQAQTEAKKRDLRVRWHTCSFDALPVVAPGPFDLITCLGNSIVHLLSDKELLATLGAFGAVLQPGGHLVLSLLNYQPILRDRQRIVGATSGQAGTFVRFYDFLDDDQLRFNVMTVRTAPQPDADLLSTRIRALTCEPLVSALRRVGLERIQAWGSLELEEFDPEVSDLLVLEAAKPSEACD
jgi:SAM-dependent methyltransferase